MDFMGQKVHADINKKYTVYLAVEIFHLNPSFTAFSLTGLRDGNIHFLHKYTKAILFMILFMIVWA